MARRRINRKVAIPGLVVLLGLMVLVVAVGWHRYGPKDPEKLLAKARAAVADARYPDAERYFAQAFAHAPNDAEKIDILFEVTDTVFLLDRTDVPRDNPQYHEPQWTRAVVQWQRIVNIDPKNVKARRLLLDYFYEMADSGVPDAWSRVQQEAQALLDTADAEAPDPFVLTALGRAKLEIAALGQVAEREKTLAEARDILEQVRQANPDDVDVYEYLARLELVQGQIEELRGIPNAQRQAAQRAEEVLRQAVTVAPDATDAHVNLLSTRLAAAQTDPEALAALEKDFQALVQRFPDAPEVYTALSNYHRAQNDLDAAVEALEKARSLGPLGILHSIELGRLYYRKSSVTSDPSHLNRALQIVTEALGSPNAKDLPGPRQSAHRMNRLALHNTLATWHADQALALDEGTAERAKHIEQVKASVHQIEQIIAVAENPMVQKWRGLLALVQGRRDEAIAQMYQAHREMMAAGRSDPFLAHTLAGLFTDEDTIGMRQQLLDVAIYGHAQDSIALVKPEALLEYARVLIKVRQYDTALRAVRSYERTHQTTDHSQALRIEALVGAGQFEEAQALMETLKADEKTRVHLELLLVQGRIAQAIREQAQMQLARLDEADAKRLEALADEVKRLQPQRAALVERLLTLDPSSVDFSLLVAAGNAYVNQDQTDKAKTLVDAYLERVPSDGAALIYRRLLDEPDPLAIPPERQRTISEEAITQGFKDPVERALALADLFSGDYDKAAEQYQAALKLDAENEQAITRYFNLALGFEKLDVAKEMADRAKTLNLDRCQGRFFTARLALAQGDLERALREVDAVLAARPVFPQAYQVRSTIQRAMGRTPQALEDIQTAAEMAPLNTLIARQRASMLFEQYDRVRASATPEQRQELRTALLRSMILNPRDWQILSLYAEFLYEAGRPDEVAQALAIRQRLLSEYPNLMNAMSLGSMAMRLAGREEDEIRRRALYDLAGNAFEQALAMEGSEEDREKVRTMYAEYLRITGRQQQAEAVFQDQPGTLWQFYLRDGQYAKARAILLALHEKDPKDTTVLRGLVLAASAAGRRDELQTYLERLLDIENTPDNEVLKLQMYLEHGINREATRKHLASYRERFPNDARGVLLEAWLATTEGRLDEALKLANRTLQLVPEDATAWRLRGLIHRLRNDLPQAIEDLENSRRRQPNNATIRMELAQAYVRAGRISAAVGELKAALNDPQAPDRAREMLEALLQRTDEEALWTFYQQTLEKFPDDTDWMMRAGLFAMQSGRLETAREILKKAWDQCPQGPDDAAKFDLYLESLLQSRRYETLIAEARPHTEGPFAAVAYAQMAQAHMKMGSRVQALSLYYQALEHSGTDDRLMLGVLQNMSQVVGVAEVEKWCRTRLQANPDALSPNLMMFILNRRAGEYNAALGYVSACMRIVGQDDPMWTRLAIDKSNVLIQAYVKTSDKQYLLEGIAALEDVLRVQPQNSTVLNNLAYLLADNNERLDQAVAFARQALDLRPDDPVLMDTYAYTLVKAGRFEEAERMAQMAIHYHEMSKPDAPWDAYEHLGMAQEGLGKKTDAKVAYERAMSIGKDSLTETDRQELEAAIARVSE